MPSIYQYDSEEHRKIIKDLIDNKQFHIINANHIIEAGPTISSLNKVKFNGIKIITMHNVDFLNFRNSIAVQKKLSANLSIDELHLRWKLMNYLC